MNYYLRTLEDYEREYDESTVESCRLKQKRALYQNKHKSKKVAQELARLAVLKEMLNRYEYKKQRIAERTARDTNFDELLENSKAPEAVLCTRCHNPMTLVHKSFQFSFRDQYWDTSKPLFHFKCQHRCDTLRVVYEDGTDEEQQSLACPDCTADLRETWIQTERNTEIYTLSCDGCGFEDVGEHVLDMEEKDPNLESDIKRYCLTDTQATELKQSLDI